MRMFLVGMCDIFLILYLTTLTQVRPEDVSSLTVSDYRALEESAKELQQLRDKQEQEIRLARSETEKILAELREREKQLKAAQESAARAKDSSENTEEQVRQAMAEAAKLSAQVEDALKARKEAERKAAEAAAKLTKVSADFAAVSAKAADMEAEVSRQRKLQAQLKKETEAAKKMAEEEQKKAQEALRARQIAEQAKQQALEQAAYAEARKEEAIALASQAAQVAEVSKSMAVRASQRAETALDTSRSTRAQLKAVTQSARAAYSRNIEGKLITVEIKRQEDSLLGPRVKTHSLRLLPVTINNVNVVFIPLALLHDGKTLPRVLPLSAKAAGRPAVSMFVNREKSLAALLVPSGLPAAQVLRSRAPELYTPTLLALHNGTPPENGESSSYFFFPRDLLLPSGGELRYAAQTSSGTQEFPGRILPGDQIVDIEGNFVGVASRHNYVELIDDIESWPSVGLIGLNNR